MPVYAPTGTTWEMTMFWRQAGHLNASVFHFLQSGGAVDTTEVITVRNLFFTSFLEIGGAGSTLAEKILALQSAQSRYQGGRIQALIPPTPPAPIDIPVAPTPGLVAGDPLPPQSALLFSQTSLGPGRSGKGRKYVPGLVEANQNNGYWEAAFLASNDMLDLLGSMSGMSASFVNILGQTVLFTASVYSRKLLTSFPIVNAAVRPTVKSQRRRAAREI